MKQLFTALSIILFALIASCSSLSEKDAADTIFINGIVYTVDDANTQAQAVAVKDGMITAVGETSSIEKLKGENTHVVDLQGKTMTPGFI